MTEARMRQRVVAALREMHAVSVEAGGAPGIPDVNHSRGWMELKQIGAWPARDETIVRIEHFTEQQRIWIRNRHRALDLQATRDQWGPRGLVHVLLRVGPGPFGNWVLMAGAWAADHLGVDATRFAVVANSIKSWDNGLDDADLLHTIRTTNR